MMGYSWESEEAARLNRDIFEAIYYGAVCESNELARQHGPYETYAGCPASQGLLQFDLWGVKPSDRWDWTGLKRRIQLYGLRHSQLLVQMPTASTANILNNFEGVDPADSNIFSRRILAGDFILINKHLVKDLR